MNVPDTKSLLFAVILVLLSAVSKAQTGPSRQPNIVIILADDMGYGDVSGLNPEAVTRTPHIDELAKNGISFSNAHAGASVCTPSRYGILTGRYAFRSESKGRVGTGFGIPVIEKDRTTLATFLKKAGYTTACIGKWHLGLTWPVKDDTGNAVYDPATGRSNVDYTGKVTSGPNDYGFDYSFIHPASLDMPPYVFLRNHQVTDPDIQLTSDVYPHRLVDTRDSWDKKHTKEGDVYWGKGIWWRRGEIARSFKVEDCLTNILDDGVSFIEKHASQNADKPFFLYLPLTGPHTPWMPSAAFQGKSPLGAYGDFILDIDHTVGKIKETLRRLSLDENTLIIFSSDNGAYWPQEEIALQKHNSNHGRRGQKGDVWEGGHRVPLIVSWPATITKPGTNRQLTSLTDIFATLAALTGQNPGPGSGEDSFSFLRALTGSGQQPARSSMIHHSSNGMFALQKNGWKFIDGLGSGGFTPPVRIDPVPGGPQGQLYHLQTDSLETVNVMLRHASLAAELKKELEEQIKNGRSR